MASVAVTGSTGFIGRALVAHLAGQGLNVLPIARDSLAGPSGLDMGGPSSDWAAAMSGSDVVINLAGKAHDLRRATADQAEEYRTVNALGAAHVATAAAAVGARRVVQISTAKVLGDHPMTGDRFREADPLHPVGVYAESKAEGERLVSRALARTETECVIVRLPLVFGLPFKGNLATLERAMRRGIPLPLGHPSIGKRSYVMLQDLLDLLALLIDYPQPLPEVLHARSVDLSASQVACLIGNEIGIRPRIVSIPASALRASAAAVRRPELASKLCDEMLVSDVATRAALGLALH